MPPKPPPNKPANLNSQIENFNPGSLSKPKPPPPGNAKPANLLDAIRSHQGVNALKKVGERASAEPRTPPSGGGGGLEDLLRSQLGKFKEANFSSDEDDDDHDDDSDEWEED